MLRFDLDSEQVRQYIAAALGWPAGLAMLIGIVIAPFSPEWSPRVFGLGAGLLAAALETDPDDSRPWWVKAGLALLAGLAALSE